MACKRTQARRLVGARRADAGTHIVRQDLQVGASENGAHGTLIGLHRGSRIKIQRVLGVGLAPDHGLLLSDLLRQSGLDKPGFNGRPRLADRGVAHGSHDHVLDGTLRGHIGVAASTGPHEGLALLDQRFSHRGMHPGEAQDEVRLAPGSSQEGE